MTELIGQFVYNNISCVFFCPAVFSQLLHQVQCSCMMASLTPCTTDRVTVFQLLVYLNRWSITDFGEHISLLSKEGNSTECSQTHFRTETSEKLVWNTVNTDAFVLIGSLWVYCFLHQSITLKDSSQQISLRVFPLCFSLGSVCCSVSDSQSGESQEEASSDKAERQAHLWAAADGTQPPAPGQATDRRQSQGGFSGHVLPQQGLAVQILQGKGRKGPTCYQTLMLFISNN